jgi:hypothetical protein
MSSYYSDIEPYKNGKVDGKKMMICYSDSISTRIKKYIFKFSTCKILLYCNCNQKEVIARQRPLRHSAMLIWSHLSTASDSISLSIMRALHDEAKIQNSDFCLRYIRD